MAGDTDAIEQFYEHYMPGLRLFFRARRLDRERADDCAIETLFAAMRQIQSGALREPQCLNGYVITIAHRVYCAFLERLTKERTHNLPGDSQQRLADLRKGPEAELLDRERRELAVAVLASMKPQEREILTRFYLYEQSEETIRREMGLTATQYRLLKSRAKSRFGELGRRRIQRRAVAAVGSMSAA